VFDSWGRVVYRRRRLILEIAAIAVALVASWSTGVFGLLQSSGGFTPPGSQSQRSSDLATAAFGGHAGDVVVLYSSPTQTVRSPAFRAAVTSVLARLPRSRVESVATYWSTGSPQFVSASGRETFALIELAGSDDSARRSNYDAIRWQLLSPWLQTQVGGVVPTSMAISQEVTSDIGRAEGLSLWTTRCSCCRGSASATTSPATPPRRSPAGCSARAG
jgi:trehalose monomycolate/heme transporter